MQETGDKINAPIKSRLRNYLKQNNIAIKAFCSTIGISDSAFRGSGLKSELGGEIITRVLQELPQVSARWLITGVDSSISEGNAGHHVNISNQEQGNLAYAIAHGDSSSASANVSMCQQLEMCMQLLQERDRQLQEKDNQIQQLHQMLQVLIKKEV